LGLVRVELRSRAISKVCRTQERVGYGLLGCNEMIVFCH